MSFEHAGLRAKIDKLSASAALALAAGLLMAPAASYADHTDDEDHEKVGVCHRTGSDTNPFVFIRVGAPATEDDHGHDQHEDDIVGATEAQCDEARDDVIDEDEARKNEDKKEKKDKNKFADSEDENEGHGRGHGPPPGRGRGQGGRGR